MNTSMGYHTFSFFQKTDYDEFYRLSSDFILYANKNTDMKRFPVKKMIWRDGNMPIKIIKAYAGYY